VGLFVRALWTAALSFGCSTGAHGGQQKKKTVLRGTKRSLI
jgi:hypothetical protein